MTGAAFAGAERLTLAVLMCGIASLALSDFVSPFYWSLSVLAALLRLWRGPGFALSEMQASLIGWFGFFWVGIELLLGREWIVAFTDFMLILALAVVIEAPTPRNHLHRMLVGLFLALAAAVLTDSFLYLLPLTALMWFMWRASFRLYGLNWPGGDLQLPPAGRDMPIMLGMAVLAALLFVAMPRFEAHSLLQPTQPRMQTSGFSDQVELGDFARQLDPTVMMRVEPAQPLPEDALNDFRRRISDLYWRGATLGYFTGRGWRQLPGRAAAMIRRGGDIGAARGGLDIAVYREATDHGYLPLPQGLSAIVRMPEMAVVRRDGALLFDRPPARRLRIRMQTAGREQPALAAWRAPLPQEMSRRLVPAALRAWVAAQRRGGEAPVATLQRLRRILQGWTYDLQAPVDAQHPVASFLRMRRGHCELYATALALAARELGLPARVVNGYFGGEWNEVGGFLLLRRQHAHSWVEVWLDGRWQLMDATPPSRWQMSGVRFQALDDVWESIRLGWYRYVLEFQDSDRAALLRGLWERIERHVLVLAGLLLAALPGLRLLRRRRPRRRGSLWPLLDAWLKRHGRERSPSQTLRSLPVPAGVDEGRWRRFVSAWEAQAYGAASPWNRRLLRRHLRAL